MTPMEEVHSSASRFRACRRAFAVSPYFEMKRSIARSASRNQESVPASAFDISMTALATSPKAAPRSRIVS